MLDLLSLDVIGALAIGCVFFLSGALGMSAAHRGFQKGRGLTIGAVLVAMVGLFFGTVWLWPPLADSLFSFLEG